MNKTILTLDEYLEQELRNIKLFHEFYKAENQANPQQWPAILESRDWDEQYFFWSQQEKQIKQDE